MADGDKISQWAILASVVSTGEGETITVNITRFVLAFSILLIVFFVHNCLSHTLSALPSIHWSAPWCRVFILWQVYLDRRRLAHYAGHMSKAGRILPVIRVAPNEVSIMTTAGLDVVYKGAFDRSSHYSVFQNYGTANLFSFQERTKHAARKRVIGPAYSKTSVCAARVQGIIHNKVQKLVGFLGKQAQPGMNDCRSGPLIPRNVFRAMVVDIITAFALSESSGTDFVDRLRPGPNTMQEIGMGDFALWNQDERDKFFFFESQPEFKPFINFLAPQAGPTHVKMETYIGQLLERYEKELSDHRVSKMETLNSWEDGPYHRLFNARDSYTRENLSWNERASEILDHIGAGYDPLVCTIEYILQQLTQYPDMQTKIRIELRETLPPEAGSRTYTLIDSLPYLEALVLESLRTITSVETYQPRVVPPGGCTIEGYYLPEGTVVSSQPYLINNHAAYFHSPFDFNPDRWLVGKDECNALKNRLWTFSSGPRACIGKHLAMAIIKITLAEVLYNFETKVVPDDEKVWRSGTEAKKIEFCVIRK